LRRNALVAAGNVGSRALLEPVEEYAESDDPVLRDTAQWARGRIAERAS
jgi:epoxyqueuosine reductase QueG